jgi:hypothetical protein
MSIKKSSKKESKYIVVSCFDINKFVTDITNYINEGYITVGGVATSIAPNHQYQVLYSQALLLNI